MRTGGLRSIWSNPKSLCHTHPTFTPAKKTNQPYQREQAYVSFPASLHSNSTQKNDANDQVSNPRSTFLKMIPLDNTLMVLTQNDDPYYFIPMET